jgi:hypothetical protein
MTEAEQVMNRGLPIRRQEAYVGNGSTAWAYVMLSREQSRVVLKRIVEGKRPGVTLAVWHAALSYAEWNTGQIAVPVGLLAEAAGTTPTEAYRALSYLVELEALIRTARGRYSLNPDVAWSGTLVSREGAAAELTPAE